jgi:N-hydroxyarylamine O-acetyltransferase
MIDIDAYFQRIGYSGPRTPSLDTLRALHARHPQAIPFENLDALRRRSVRLDAESLQRKLVTEKRGGYCFEQNTLFSQVLQALGFRVEALSARVLWERPDDVRARTHMLLFVQLGEGGYLCDVGFGGLTMTAPLRLEPDVEQATPHETFRVRRDGRELVSEALVRGGWRSLYRFDLQPQLPIDIEVLNFYVSGHADSPFLTRVMAARRTDDRTYALRDGELAVHHRNGSSERRALGGVAEMRSVLRETFGIDVPDDAVLDAAFARALAAAPPG